MRSRWAASQLPLTFLRGCWMPYFSRSKTIPGLDDWFEYHACKSESACVRSLVTALSFFSCDNPRVTACRALK